MGFIPLPLGIRSDSDMYTLGYNFKPWNQSKAIADGWHPFVLIFMKPAQEYDVNRHIRYGHKVLKAAWSTPKQHGPLKPPTKQASLLPLKPILLFPVQVIIITKQVIPPNLKAVSGFKGQIIHPQLWPENLDYSNKKW